MKLRLKQIYRFVLLTLVGALSPAHAEKLPKLILAGPPAAVSTPLIHRMETGALMDVADSVEFVVWKDPDQLRVLALGGKADFVAMPSNVAANLYNRGVGLKRASRPRDGVPCCSRAGASSPTSPSRLPQ